MSFALGETSTGAASGDAGELAISGDGATIPGHLLEEPAAKGGRRGRGSPAKIGRFVILRTLGEGGMGVVYSAYDDELDRKLAIKVVRSALAGRDVSRARIRREAQAMAKLSH
ncbi:MAG: serine/threonine protein kinase, partial [Myxococcales bacterium]|nr:serine/threonine protein kinase [Myxococcales bacterium]